MWAEPAVGAQLRDANVVQPGLDEITQHHPHGPEAAEHNGQGSDDQHEIRHNRLGQCCARKRVLQVATTDEVLALSGGAAGLAHLLQF